MIGPDFYNIRCNMMIIKKLLGGGFGIICDT